MITTIRQDLNIDQLNLPPFLIPKNLGDWQKNFPDKLTSLLTERGRIIKIF